MIFTGRAVAPSNTDGANPSPCHAFSDNLRTGGIALCTRPQGHGGPHVDRVHNVTFQALAAKGAGR